MSRELTEQEKLRVIELVDIYGQSWKLIGTIIGRHRNTCQSFYDSYIRHKTISPTRGRPKTIDSEMKEGVFGSIMKAPDQTLRQVASDFEISHTSVRSILKENHLKYFQKSAVTPLTIEHKNERIILSNKFKDFNYYSLPKIIFSDESLFENSINSGIWRVPGQYPPQSFFPKTQKPLSVMIWGGIGPYGYRTKLLHFNQNVDSYYYCEQLIKNGIFSDLNSKFGNQWVWQEDNATPHSASFTQSILKKCVSQKIKWPPRSPDLSPIEQVWDYMKKKVNYKLYNSEIEYFNAISECWYNIPNDIIHNFHSSFLARCNICSNIQGESLNGHWKDVKKFHNQYRTKLVINGNHFYEMKV